jgi:hypothetical protein
MPSAKEHQQMDALEDPLASVLEAEGFATLDLVISEDRVTFQAN